MNLRSLALVGVLLLSLWKAVPVHAAVQLTTTVIRQDVSRSNSPQYDFSRSYSVTIENLTGASFSSITNAANREVTRLKRSLCPRSGELVVQSMELLTGVLGNGAGNGLSERRITMVGNARATVLCRIRTRTTNENNNASGTSSASTAGTCSGAGNTGSNSTSTAVTNANCGNFAASRL